jgi:hypothetical protein
MTVSGRLPDPERVREIVMEEAQDGMRQSLLLVEAEWKHRLVPNLRGYRTGTYSRSITNNGGVRVGNFIKGLVGTNVQYAPYLEYGTGLYGPRHRWIEPRTAKALRFPARVGAGTPFTLAGRRRSGRAGENARYVFARRVRGIRPRRYARDAAMIAAPKVGKVFEAAGRRAAVRIGSGLER